MFHGVVIIASKSCIFLSRMQRFEKTYVSVVGPGYKQLHKRLSSVTAGKHCLVNLHSKPDMDHMATYKIEY